MKHNRFRFLAGLLALGLVAASCGGGSTTDNASGNEGGGESSESGGESSPAADCEVGQNDGDMSLYNWTEYLDPDLLAKFTEETGIGVTESFYDSNEAMQPIVMAGSSGHDVVVPSDYMVSILIDAAKAGETSIMPLNRDAIPNLANLDPDFASGLPYDPEAEYSVPYQWGTTGLGINIAALGEDVPHTWGLIFDPALAEQYGTVGSASLLNDPRETLGAALKYLGYSLNSTDPAELEEAKAIIVETKDRITAFDTDQAEELLVQGDTVVAHGFSGNFITNFDAADNPDDFTYFVPDEGGTRWVDNMAVVADAPHPCSAHTFINFILDAENGAALTNWNYFASPNAASEEFIDPEVLSDPIVYPTDRSKLEFIADTGDYEINFADAFIEAKG